MRKIMLTCFIIMMFTTNIYAEDFEYILAEGSGVDMYNKEQEEIKLGSKGVILYDANTGRILYGENIDEKLPMASTTKIMTLLVALENADLNDMVKISKNATKAPKVKMYLNEGEEVRLENLLYALSLESFNDCVIIGPNNKS